MFCFINAFINNFIYVIINCWWNTCRPFDYNKSIVLSFINDYGKISLKM